MVRLRVATYNVRDLLDDVGAVAQVLRLLEADVVCLQEVPRHLLGDVRTTLLARRTGYHAPLTHALGGGTTVLWSDRVAAARVRHVPLRVPVAQRRRGCTVLDARVDAVDVRVVSLHLGLHEVQRRRHATQVRSLVGDAPLVVVAGDANEAGRGPGLTALGLDPLGRRRPTYPADAPEAALDVVEGRGWAWAREVDLDLGRLGAQASDHLPRVVDLGVEPSLRDEPRRRAGRARPGTPA